MKDMHAGDATHSFTMFEILLANGTSVRLLEEVLLNGWYNFGWWCCWFGNFWLDQLNEGLFGRRRRLIGLRRGRSSAIVVRSAIFPLISVRLRQTDGLINSLKWSRSHRHRGTGDTICLANTVRGGHAYWVLMSQ